MSSVKFLVEDFFKFCGSLRISELYATSFPFSLMGTSYYLLARINLSENSCESGKIEHVCNCSVYCATMCICNWKYEKALDLMPPM